VEWLEIAVPAAPADVEPVADVLRRHAPAGVSIEETRSPRERGGRPSADGRALVKAYLPLDAELPRKRRALRRDLCALPLTSSLPRLRGRRVREEDWADAWKRFFGVEHVGRRLVVCPSWRRYRPAPGEIVVRLDPGMAFGTGQHPTTRLCLTLLETHLRPGDRVLDLGTGSGILAIAAALLGAGEVLALDVDAVAVKVAKANAAANGVEDRVTVAEGTLGASGSSLGPFDCVAININAETILEVAAAVVAALRPGGVAIVSGITTQGVGECSQALTAAGAPVREIAAEDCWRAVVVGGS
jgi:ribosomal protein L11 methyltransferase